MIKMHFEFFRLLPLLVLLASCRSERDREATPAERLTRLEIQQPLMGTLFQVTCYHSDPPTARQAIDGAFAAARAFSSIVTDYHPDSELNQFCRAPYGTPFPLSPTLFQALTQAQEVAHLTDGACDPTLGPITHLWRRAKRKNLSPSEDDLSTAISRTGYQNLLLNPQRQTGTLLLPGMQLDLGAFAKGQAADLIHDYLQSEDIPITLITAGGDLRLGDPPPGEKGWTVAIRQHAEDLSPPRLLSSCAVSTSGSLYQTFQVAGSPVSHLIDPKTGRGIPLTSSASVIAPTATLSDPLATAACLLERPEAFFASHPQWTLITP